MPLGQGVPEPVLAALKDLRSATLTAPVTRLDPESTSAPKHFATFLRKGVLPVIFATESREDFWRGLRTVFFELDGVSTDEMFQDHLVEKAFKNGWVMQLATEAQIFEDIRDALGVNLLHKPQ